MRPNQRLWCIFVINLAKRTWTRDPSFLMNFLIIAHSETQPFAIVLARTFGVNPLADHNNKAIPKYGIAPVFLPESHHPRILVKMLSNHNCAPHIHIM